MRRLVLVVAAVVAATVSLCSWATAEAQTVRPQIVYTKHYRITFRQRTPEIDRLIRKADAWYEHAASTTGLRLPKGVRLMVDAVPGDDPAYRTDSGPAHGTYSPGGRIWIACGRFCGSILIHETAHALLDYHRLDPSVEMGVYGRWIDEAVAMLAIGPHWWDTPQLCAEDVPAAPGAGGGAQGAVPRSSA